MVHLGRRILHCTRRYSNSLQNRMGDSLFASCPLMPPTAIFHLTARFKEDKHPKKLNLGVGAYRDESLKPVVFSAVRKAEQAVVNAGFDKEYLPVTGLPALTAAAAKLMFGAEHPALQQKRIASCQTLSGTGSLTVAAQLLRRLNPAATVYVSEPTWENHGKVLRDAGLAAPKPYRYYDAATCGLDLKGLLEDLNAMPEHSVVLMHACAHNPTGVDPSHEQWQQIAEVIAQRKLLAWFDIAYQGFASGNPDVDAWAVRHFAAQGMELMVSQSFAKNFGMYCERVGALHVVTPSTDAAAAVSSMIETIVRPMYSNPPAHGARVVAHILNSPDLEKEWLAEVSAAMDRVKRMRTLLRDALQARGTPGDWSHITKQIGMFSYTGLNKQQCDRMVEQFHVYMLDTGRINVAGLNEKTVPILADAMHAVVTDAPLPEGY